MTRTQKLKPVVSHAEKKEQAALQAIAISQQQLQMQQQRLTQLVAYKQEYITRQEESDRIYSAVQMQEFQRFLDQLDQTMKQQEKVIAMAEREVEFKREKWRKTRSRSDALHKVVDKLHAAQRKEEDRREQKAQDEFSARLFSQKS